MRLFRQIALAVGAAIMVTGAAMAAPPAAPTNLTGTWAFISGSGTPVIHASWNTSHDPADSSGRYGTNVYLGVPQGGMIYFRVVASVEDTLPGYAQVSLPVNAMGTYYLFVASYNNDGEGAHSDTIMIDVSLQNEVRYPHSSYGDDTIFVGDTYHNTFTAIGPPNSAIVYSLGYTNMTGATYGSTSGLFSWTPSATGQYTAYLVARLAHDSTVSATAILTLNVVNGPHYDSLIHFTHGDRHITVDEGSTLSDTMNAVAANGGTVWYALNGEPTGMQIDAQTGVVSWASAAILNGTGIYNIRVDAGLDGESQPRVSINYRVTVSHANPSGALTGYVRDSSGTHLIDAVVTLYREIQAAGAVTYQAVAHLGTRQGWFAVSNLNSGTYIAQAFPLDSSMYAPGYYVANGLASLTWAGATRFSVGPNTFNDTIVFRMPYANGHHGSNRVDGTIVGVPGAIRKGNDNGLAGAAPVAGAVVLVVDDAGLVSGYDVTDDAGAYRVDGIGIGTFTVVVDKVGFRPLVQTIAFSDDNGSNESIDVELQSVSGGSGVPINGAAEGDLVLFPNPASNAVAVRLPAGEDYVTVRVIDNQGVERMLRRFDAGAAGTLVQLETNGLVPGRYLITVTGRDGIGVATLVIAR